MGGNALKNTWLERKNLVDYNRIKATILETLKLHIKCEIIEEAPEKDSFGDLDVLYISNKDINIKELVVTLFNPNEIVKNGDVISFDYDAFQIDMIKATCEDFESKKFYFGYGDLGCILGKMVNFYKLKFGSQGLWINIENTIDGESLGLKRDIGKDLILTTRPTEFCNFFDLDYSKRQIGFTTQKEMFDWICSSKYFIKGIFQIENMADRDRMETRKVYQNFMSYIWKDIIDTTKPKRIYLQKYAIEHFNKQEEFNSLIKQVKLFEERKIKYSGKLFIDLGFSGKEIPIKMKEFEKTIEHKMNKTFNDWLDSANQDIVKTELTNFFEK